MMVIMGVDGLFEVGGDDCVSGVHGDGFLFPSPHSAATLVKVALTGPGLLLTMPSPGFL